MSLGDEDRVIAAEVVEALRAPDSVGQSGKAWRCTLKPEHEKIGNLVTWLIYVPHVHAFWSFWMLSVAHLRELPGMPPPNLAAPGMQYELSAMAIDPRSIPHPDTPELFRVMTPQDVCEQFAGCDDAQAIRLAELCARACTDGMLCPDSDFRSQWAPTVVRTLEHMIAGSHGPQAGTVES